MRSCGLCLAVEAGHDQELEQSGPRLVAILATVLAIPGALGFICDLPEV